jgi:hypothetical protein
LGLENVFFSFERAITHKNENENVVLRGFRVKTISKGPNILTITYYPILNYIPRERSFNYLPSVSNIPQPGPLVHICKIQAYL